MTENGRVEIVTRDLDDGASILTVMRRAVHNALLDHKQAGNSVAIWEDGRVIVVPPEEIVIPDPTCPEERSALQSSPAAP